VALSYAAAIGGGKAGIIETSFKEETRPTCSQQTVLCGGCVELVKAGFDTLVEAGYAPEMAYFECLHELKLIVDLDVRGRHRHHDNYYRFSNNAEYGEYVTGPRIIDEATRSACAMAAAHPDGRVRQGVRAGEPRRRATLLSRRRMTPSCRSRGRSRLREMMPWIKRNRTCRHFQELKR